ncbi:TadE-like protein [Nocardioides dokdonensis FR1436]|uniref:TadE-like protein n=1 Tax=Nocardioides dokdonensis FR1436 TaxID=1300347 RepID=A0A1A9GMX5_9ACTN|nr:TadE/TadG family type IV pilus assembly protein [Nocardioides dokdonensis]ANH38953.1 TadE-like protein [Nocardioides dokdonensis FR1436]
MFGGDRRERERGAAAVEFALVVPLLLLLVFGIISYGYMLSFRQAISQAAAEGARAAAVAPAAFTTGEKQTAANNAIKQALDSYGVVCGTGAMTCSVVVKACPADLSRDCAVVTLDYLYSSQPLIPKFPLVPLPEHLAYSAVAEVS